MLERKKFDDLVRLNRGFDLPDSQVVEGEYPVVASTSIKTYHKEYKIEPPVVVTGRSGTLGKVQYINEKCWPLNTTLYAKDYRDNYPLYVYYYLQTLHLEQYNAGAGVPTLNQNHLQKLKILVHDRKSQEAIADSLYLYDCLIEQNNKKIKLLNQMAGEIYKEWFIRFRFPGHEKIGLKKSKIGMIPECFDEAKMENVFDYYIGGGWGNEEQDKDFSQEAYVIRGADFPSIVKGDVSSCPLRYHKPSNYKKRVLQKNDIILEVSGGTAEQPVGRTVLVDEDILERLNRQVICASFCKLVRLKANISPYYFYYWMQFLYDTRIIDRFQLQSTGIINFKFEYFLRKGDVLMPPMEIMKQFEEAVKPLYDEKHLLARKNDNLIKQRDILIPRLLSGKNTV